MDKKTYLAALFDYLKAQKVTQEDINKVTREYEDLYQEALDSGKTDDEVRELLGTPESIYKEIKGDLEHFVDQSYKIVALMPFISLVLFFLGGYLLGGWTYSWLAFLLIPVTAILVNVKGKDKFVALSPFVSVSVFMGLGLGLGIWHPTWLLFLLIPMTAIFLHVDHTAKLVSLSPFVAVTAYVLTAFFYPEFYQYGWAVFAIIPIAVTLTDPISIRKIIVGISIIIAVVAHLLLYFLTGTQWAFLSYAFPIVVAVVLYFNKVRLDFVRNYAKHPFLTVSAITIIIIFVAVSIIFDAWKWSWTMLLVIPMLGIYSELKFKVPVAYTPFLSLALFYLTGYFLGWWSYSWLFFLMVPIFGILQGTEKVKSKW